MRRSSGSRWSSSAWRRSRSPSARVSGSCSARYSAAEARVRVNEALTGVSRELGTLAPALEHAEWKAEGMEARAAAIDSLVASGGLELAASREPALGAAVDRAAGAPAARARLTVESIRKLCDDLHMRHMRAVVLIAGGAALGAAAYHVQVHDLGSPTSRAVATVVVAWAFLAAGLVAWSRRPANLVGPLMIAAGLALLARQLRYSHNPECSRSLRARRSRYALVAHSVLAYPTGRLTGRTERVLVKAGYVVAGVFPLLILLLHEGDARLRQSTVRGGACSSSRTRTPSRCSRRRS